MGESRCSGCWVKKGELLVRILLITPEYNQPIDLDTLAVS
jgi:hypothetical protein